jgi:hypothetical protein
MNAIDNGKMQDHDISLGLLLEALTGAKVSPLIFYYDGQRVKPGYHVTEVKAGKFAALDCGANPESWNEIFVQLWDVDDGGRTHMTAGKFQAIIGKVTEHVELGGSAKLTFEVSDGLRPMQLYHATIPVLRDGVVEVELAPRPASCKPRDRWLAEEAQETDACCASAHGKSACCAPTPAPPL